MKRFFAVVAVLGILGFAFVGCDDGDNEIILLPTKQTYTLEGVTTASGSVDVKITYMAVSKLPLPGYMTTLEKVIRDVLPDAFIESGILTINVTVDAVDGGFVKTDTKTLAVRNTWISGAKQEEMLKSLELKMADWVSVFP
jgi:hypothetical protein